MAEHKSGRTLVDVLRHRAEYQGGKVAYRFLPDGEREAASVTYAELDRQARLIAGRLQGVAARGARALLMYPSGLEYVAAFFGCLYAGIIGVPVFPPQPNRRPGRLLSVAADCQADVILSAGVTAKQALPMPVEAMGANPRHAIDTSDAASWPGSLAAQWQPPVLSDADIAFLQYTSGSTAEPKGVMVSHGNIMHNQKFLQEALESSAETVMVCWLPMHHDMGLIGFILASTYLGAACVMLPPAAFIQRPARWLEAISRYRATYSGAPNFGYELCIRSVAAEQRAAIDLSSWKVAANGAEPIRWSTLVSFQEKFGPCGFGPEVFRPCYGLAEGTLLVSCGIAPQPIVSKSVHNSALELNRVVEAEGNAKILVSSGKIHREQKLAIVHPETRRICSEGEVGEIWISGPSAAQGYWNHPELNEANFRAHTADTNEGPFLRTGDLGFVQEGNVYVAGRHKDLIIIHGRNHYPQDIEQTVEACHAALRPGCGAAFSMEVDGQERLVIVSEVQRSHIRSLNREEVEESIRRAVAAEHELDVFQIELVKPATVPKTSSGKIQRRLCRKKYLAGDLEKLENRRGRVAPLTTQPSTPRYATSKSPMEFSLFYFSSNEESDSDKYKLLLDGARFADDHDFTAVWVPERHFHPFGGIYPNPSVLAAALAVSTNRIRIRAGSVVLPLHNPIRVAEEWAVVDNLSKGRVDLALARGWNPNDFVLMPQNYPEALKHLYNGLSTLRALWSGGKVEVINGTGQRVETRIFPLPHQREIPIWITCTGGMERFVETGRGGFNVLTALLFQSTDELAEKLNAYRAARAESGYDPASGHVTLMMHTFVGGNESEVKKTVRGPFIEYLKSSTDLWRQNSRDLSELSDEERKKVLDFAFERYYRTSGLFGTPDTCLPMIAGLKEIGVDEIACLIDFGVDTRTVLKNLNALSWLHSKAQSLPAAEGNAAREKLVATGVATRGDVLEHTLLSTSLSSSRSEGRSSPRDAALLNVDISMTQNDELLQWMREVTIAEIARVTESGIEAILPGKHFLSLGINSLKAVEIMSAIQTRFEVELPYSLLFEFPTVERLTAAVAREHRSRLLHRMKALASANAPQLVATSAQVLSPSTQFEALSPVCSAIGADTSALEPQVYLRDTGTD